MTVPLPDENDPYDIKSIKEALDHVAAGVAVVSVTLNPDGDLKAAAKAIRSLVMYLDSITPSLHLYADILDGKHDEV